jgi:hypothetical protein
MQARIKVLTFVLVLVIAGCDGFTHIKGRVTDMNGKPVQGALVEMKTISGGRDDQLKSASDGSFSVGFSHAPWNVDLALTVSKEGYKTFEKRFKSADAKQFPATIILEPVQNVDDTR